MEGMWNLIERKRNEEIIQNREATLNSIFRAAPVGIGMVINQVFQEVNDTLCSMVGYSKEELVGKSARIIYPSDDEFNYVGAKKYNQIAEAGTGSAETRWKTKDGTIIDIFLKSTPLDPTDLNKGLTFTALDITERKRIEKEREKLIKELELKNTELESFNYTVSHDLKSPLITIKGFIGMLENDLTSGNKEKLDSNLQRIKEAADKMASLLEDLLALSKIGQVASPRVEIPFQMLISEALALLSGSIEKSKIQIIVQPDLPVVYGVHRRLVEVLQNLIENAIKFMGGQNKPRIEIGMIRKEDKIIFFVKDNGIGIEPRYHETIFGLFNKLNARSEGTGIGLALVKRIIEVHGGKIWIESKGFKKGSTFCFTIPATKRNH
jgi:PAS domain S-box-containing protein